MTIPSSSPVEKSFGSNGLRAEIRGEIGLITLTRPRAMNALSLDMVRCMTAALLAWDADDTVTAVVVRGATEPGRGVAFCAGGDIRFFHQAALAGDPRLEDFFTEEYRLNHLIYNYRKPYVALMDGICMGGGMGIAQGGRIRVVTERSKLAMPETHIGLFPDVGGGYFLSRCDGRLGEYLALTGAVLDAADSVALGLADLAVSSGDLDALVEALCDQPHANEAQVRATVQSCASEVIAQPSSQSVLMRRDAIDLHFGHESIQAIEASLEGDSSDWAQATLITLRKQSPLAMGLSLAQIRRARTMTLAQALRLERDMVRNCFHIRPGVASETVEGVRALAIDKDHKPRWNPATIQEVTPEMVSAYLQSPWPVHAHPLRDLT
jgi:enoyl-CoA hydratase/carnithine racemase